MICDKLHRYEIKFHLLPERQAKAGRHVCAGCANELGKAIARTIDIEALLQKLPVSQAGAVRHRNSYVAFIEGLTEELIKQAKEKDQI